jgi:hypothetical protein
MRLVVLTAVWVLLLAIAGAQQSSLNEWADMGAVDLVVKIGAVTPVGRLGLAPATTASGGPDSLQTVDLELLAPGKITTLNAIDISSFVSHHW